MNTQTNAAFDDSLDDLIGGAPRTATRAPVTFTPVLERAFTEACPACNGTGKWKGIRSCFKCNSTGKLTFKTSAEDRAKARTASVTKKANNIEEFTKEFPEIIEWFKRSTNFPFAVSLQESLVKYGSLTDNQIAAARRCIAKYEAAKEAGQARRENAKAVDLTALDAAFAKASDKLRKPNLRVGGFSIYKKPDGLVVYNAEVYGAPAVGKVRDGKFIPGFKCTAEQEEAFLEVANDPYGAAIKYGKASGRCAICNHVLTAGESLERGIGPICAEKFGW